MESPRFSNTMAPCDYVRIPPIEKLSFSRLRIKENQIGNENEKKRKEKNLLQVLDSPCGTKLQKPISE